MKIPRVIFNFYLYVGLGAGLFLVLKRINREYDRFSGRTRKTPASGINGNGSARRARSSADGMNAVKQVYPHDKLLFMRMPRTPQQTYLLKMNGPNDLFVYADPYTGMVLGAHRQGDTFIGWIALIHAELLIGERGNTMLGISALLLICMAVTGLFLWWPSSGKDRNGRARKILRGFKINWAAPWKKVVLIHIVQ